MSNINEALKKAQKEKDTRYLKYGGVFAVAGKKRSFLERRFVRWTLPLGLLLLLAFFSYSMREFKFKQTVAMFENEKASSTFRSTSSTFRSTDSTFRSTDSTPESATPTVRPASSTLRSPSSTLRSPSSTRGSAVSVPEPVRRNPAKESYDQARVFHKRGSLYEAKKLYEQTLRIDPGYVEALNNLGIIHIRDRDFQSAEDKITKALRLKPSQADFYYNLACLYAIKEEVGQSLAHLKRAIFLNPQVKDWAAIDTDLKNLQGEPEFVEMNTNSGEVNDHQG